MYRRNILGYRLETGNKEDIGKCGNSGENASDIIQQYREESGRYFGICCSYHHLKACICKDCPSYSGGAGMFCSRGKCPGQGKKHGCLCQTCEIFRKLQFEGEYFCLQAKKPEFSKEKPEFSEEPQKSSECDGEEEFCVVENSNM